MSAGSVGVVDKLKMQAAILASPSLSATAKLVGVRMILFFNLKTGQCNPSAPRLAKECSVSRTSVFEGLKALVSDGWFSRGAFDPETSTYNYVPAWERIAVDDGSAESKPPQSEVQILNGGSSEYELRESKLRTEGVQNPYPNREGNIEKNKEVNTGRRAHHRQHDSDLFEAISEQQKPNRNQSQKPPKKKAKALSTPIPLNWQLPDDGWSFAASRGFTGERIETEIERFRAYYEGTGKRKANWEATWRSWILNDQRSVTTGRGPPQSGETMADGIAMMNQAMKAKQNDRTGPISEFRLGVDPK